MINLKAQMEIISENEIKDNENVRDLNEQTGLDIPYSENSDDPWYKKPKMNIYYDEVE